MEPGGQNGTGAAPSHGRPFRVRLEYAAVWHPYCRKFPRIPRGMALARVLDGDQMAQVRMRADRPWPQRRASSSRTVALVLAAFGVSAAVAAWVADPGDAGLVSANAAPSRASATSSFDERFLPPPAPQSL